MSISEKNVLISVAIDKDVKKILEKYSQEIDLTLSKFARNLIYASLDQFRLLKGVGLVKIATIFRDTLNRIKLSKTDELKNESTTDKVTISVIIDKDVKDELQRYSDELGLSLKNFARNLIYISLDDFKLLNNIGIIRLAVAHRNFIESFENYEPSENNHVLAK